MAQGEGTSIGLYLLERRLGEGGAGEVYVAAGPATVNASTGKVVVKVGRIPPESPASREMLRQVRAATQLNNPHIVPVYDVTEQDRKLLLVMGLAPGGSLGDALKSDSGRRVTLPLRPPTVVRMIVQLARTLDAAHAAGIVHGDVKPSNVFVRTSPSGAPLAALSDFGQSYLTSMAVDAMRQIGPNGSPEALWSAEHLRFVAPEQLRGPAVPASDQYALAALAYYLLTGATPIRAEGADLLQAIEQAPVARPTQVNPSLPNMVDAPLLRALSKLPEQRYPTTGAFAAAFSDALEGADSPGATQEMRSLRLNASATAMPKPGASSSRVQLDYGGTVITSDEAAAAGSQGAPLPRNEPALSLRRKLAVFVSLAVLVALVSCAVATLAFPNSGTHLAVNDALPTVSVAANATSVSTPKPSAASRQAEARLSAALATASIFADPLSTNEHQWPVNGKTIFFGSDGRLHMLNQGDKALTADKPAASQVPTGAYVVKATVTLLSGFTGDRAGLRFLAQRNNDGTESYYAYLETSEGRYELWFHNGSQSWQFMTGGYASSIKPGQKQSNQLAVLVDVANGNVLLFANGKYVDTGKLMSNGPQTGSAGLIVPDNGAEASFSDYALYSAK